jgi:hypothetical protein
MIERKQQYRHWVHEPFNMELNGVRLQADAHGRVLLSKEEKEIECSAGLVNVISKLISILDYKGMSVSIDDRIVKLTQHYTDGPDDVIEVSTDLITNASRMLLSTRDAVFKDEPFRGK